MGLTAGTRLGPYEIVSALGAGGMGEVYRARDTKLGRDVALKVIPDTFALDPDRLARFKREAQLLASLNHPHIAAIYGFEDSGETHALVLELVEGETLADRIARGAIPLDEALPVARQICEALEAAHEQGIIHRDLKPANIKITPDGVVKVLDFGLAKLAEPAGSTQPAAGSAHLSLSPTITSPAMMTSVGMLLGTAAYMSPEQAKGRPADKRSDIWAFGCVLYEMLTGKRVFPGDDMSEVLASILAREPDWSTLPAAVPPAIRALLRRCLEKDRRKRVADTAAALFALDEHANLGGSATVLPRGPLWRRIAALTAGALVVAALVGAGVWFAAHPALPTQASVRFQIPAPGASAAEMFTLSADGRYLAFVANTGGPNQLWVRSMDALEARALAGTNDATYPFWSPDGAYLGFFAQGKLKKIAIAGGPPQTLCDATSGRGGTWNRDGVILFSAGSTSPILRVSSAGGVLTAVTRLVDTDAASGHRFPVFLPDGAHYLYTAGSDKPDSSGVYVGSLDGSPAVRILADTTNALYVPPSEGSGSGHLLFRRENTLMAQPFDLETLKFSGEMFPVAGQVPLSGNTFGFGAFSASSNGTLAYRTGGATSNRELVWIDRMGKRITAATKAGAFFGAPAISPDQRTVAVGVQPMSGSQADIWLQDVGRDVISRFTFRPGLNGFPVWGPDGTRLAFTHAELTAYSFDIYVKPSSGGGREESLLHGGVNPMLTMDWSSDGQWIVYQLQGQTTGTDLWLLPLEGDRKPIPYLQTPFEETNARFSPGSSGSPRWMAYQSNESGQNQVYVQSIPPSGAKYQLSTAGGTQPAWRRDGKELFYLSTDRKLMAVPIALGASVEPGTPHELFAFANAGITGYAASPDGQRFLVNVPTGGEGAAAPPITVVLDWTAGLKK